MKRRRTSPIPRKRSVRRSNPPPISWRELYDEFLGFYLPPLHPRSTQFSVRRMLDICGELGVEKLSDLTPKLVGRFCGRTTGKHGKPITLRTVQGQLVYFRLLCRYAVSQSYLAADPTLARKVWIPDQALSEPGRTHLTAVEALDVIRRRIWKRSPGAGSRGGCGPRFTSWPSWDCGRRKSSACGLRISTWRTGRC